MTTDASPVEDVLNRVNSYTGDNIWQDVIWKLDELDQVATEDAALTDTDSTLFVLTGGQLIRYDQAAGQWYAAD